MSTMRTKVTIAGRVAATAVSAMTAPAAAGKATTADCHLQTARTGADARLRWQQHGGSESPYSRGSNALVVHRWHLWRSRSKRSCGGSRSSRSKSGNLGEHPKRRLDGPIVRAAATTSMSASVARVVAGAVAVVVAGHVALLSCCLTIGAVDAFAFSFGSHPAPGDWAQFSPASLDAAAADAAAAAGGTGGATGAGAAGDKDMVTAPSGSAAGGGGGPRQRKSDSNRRRKHNGQSAKRRRVGGGRRRNHKAPDVAASPNPEDDGAVVGSEPQKLDDTRARGQNQHHKQAHRLATAKSSPRPREESSLDQDFDSEELKSEPLDHNVHHKSSSLTPDQHVTEAGLQGGKGTPHHDDAHNRLHSERRQQRSSGENPLELDEDIADSELVHVHGRNNKALRGSTLNHQRHHQKDHHHGRRQDHNQRHDQRQEHQHRHRHEHHNLDLPRRHLKADRSNGNFDDDDDDDHETGLSVGDSPGLPGHLPAQRVRPRPMGGGPASRRSHHNDHVLTKLRVPTHVVRSDHSDGVKRRIQSPAIGSSGSDGSTRFSNGVNAVSRTRQPPEPSLQPQEPHHEGGRHHRHHEGGSRAEEVKAVRPVVSGHPPSIVEKPTPTQLSERHDTSSFDSNAALLESDYASEKRIEVDSDELDDGGGGGGARHDGSDIDSDTEQQTAGKLSRPTSQTSSSISLPSSPSALLPSSTLPTTNPSGATRHREVVHRREPLTHDHQRHTEAHAGHHGRLPSSSPETQQRQLLVAESAKADVVRKGSEPDDADRSSSMSELLEGSGDDVLAAEDDKRFSPAATARAAATAAGGAVEATSEFVVTVLPVIPEHLLKRYEGAEDDEAGRDRSEEFDVVSRARPPADASPESVTSRSAKPATLGSRQEAASSAASGTAAAIGATVTAASSERNDVKAEENSRRWLSPGRGHLEESPLTSPTTDSVSNSVLRGKEAFRGPHAVVEELAETSPDKEPILPTAEEVTVSAGRRRKGGRRRHHHHQHKKKRPDSTDLAELAP